MPKRSRLICLAIALPLAGCAAHRHAPASRSEAAPQPAAARGGAGGRASAFFRRGFGGVGRGFGTRLGRVNGALVRGRGKDAIGEYRSARFTLAAGGHGLRCSVRAYRSRRAVLFTARATHAMAASAAVFPLISQTPAAPYHLSFADRNFAPHRFPLVPDLHPLDHSDKSGNTFVISPASQLMVSRMTHSGGAIADALNPGIRTVPAGFSHQTLLVYGHGVQHTIRRWGRIFLALHHGRRPGEDANTVLKYLGYWTDNGSTYYYRFIPKLGYAGTLVAAGRYFRRGRIPVRYMQLDSWWYEKGVYSPRGRRLTAKNPRLAIGDWNVYGGIYRYIASPQLFPHGLLAFRRALRLPLVVHCRWIDRKSPYRKDHDISGIAPIGPRYWRQVAAYLAHNGVICFEQDWLDRLYDLSPALHNTLTGGRAFTGNMARAMAAKGISMQYCMPEPRFFLQGSRYANLSSIRVSDDKFIHARWNSDVYTSMLAGALRIWPFVDNTRSSGQGNMLMATLSAGPLGISDPIGRVSRANVLHAVRADGVIVKPDRPLTPTDATVIADARKLHRPLVAATETAGTKSRGRRAVYCVVYRRKGDAAAYSITPEALGLRGPVYAYRWNSNSGIKLADNHSVHGKLRRGGWAYYIFCPVHRNGMAFIGDPQQFVTCGRQRVMHVRAAAHALKATVLLAAGEKMVAVAGYSRRRPNISASGASVGRLYYNRSNGLFRAVLRPRHHALRLHVLMQMP